MKFQFWWHVPNNPHKTNTNLKVYALVTTKNGKSEKYLPVIQQ